MLAEPGQWAAYYDRDDEELGTRLAFSYSDRCRYYWAQPPLQQAVASLLRNLAGVSVPLELLSQHLPREYAAREGRAARAGAGDPCPRARHRRPRPVRTRLRRRVRRAPPQGAARALA